MRALALAEAQDRFEVESGTVRRHFWRRLLPGVGITAYMAANVVVGWGAPAWILALAFGAFTAREAVRFRDNLRRLRDVEDLLASLRAGSAPD